MMDEIEIKYSRFDQVKIITTKNVKYLSSPPDIIVTPDGLWQVTAIVDEDLLLVKNNCIIRIPTTDVLKVAEYDINHLISKLGRILDYGEDKRSKGKKGT
jgi:hypothetical protein